MKKISVLGTEYEVKTDDSISKLNIDGSCKFYDKEITIRSPENMLCDGDSAYVKQIRYAEVMRHEIIHAFFGEAGLDRYSADEQLVDWIAVQFPKLIKAFKEAGGL